MPRSPAPRKGRKHQGHHHLLNQPLYKYLHFQYERGLSNSFLYIHFLLDSHSWALLFPNSYMCRHANLEDFFLSKSSSVPLMLSFVWQEGVNLQSEIHQESQISPPWCVQHICTGQLNPQKYLESSLQSKGAYWSKFINQLHSKEKLVCFSSRLLHRSGKHYIFDLGQRLQILFNLNREYRWKLKLRTDVKNINNPKSKLVHYRNEMLKARIWFNSPSWVLCLF